MKILIAETKLVKRDSLYQFLSGQGECDSAEDGLKAVSLYLKAWKENRPYDLICLDAQLPFADGGKVVKAVRTVEKAMGVTPEKQAQILVFTGMLPAIDSAQMKEALAKATLTKITA